MEQPKKKTSMSVMEMGRLLGLGKTESYYLVKKNYFKVVTVGTTMRVMAFILLSFLMEAINPLNIASN